MPGSKKHVLVTFTQNQWKLVFPYVGTLGISQADTIRNIVMNWVLEHPSTAGSENANRPVDETRGRRP